MRLETEQHPEMDNERIEQRLEKKYTNRIQE